MVFISYFWTMTHLLSSTMNTTSSKSVPTYYIHWWWIWVNSLFLFRAYWKYYKNSIMVLLKHQLITMSRCNNVHSVITTEFFRQHHHQPTLLQSIQHHWKPTIWINKLSTLFCKRGFGCFIAIMKRILYPSITFITAWFNEMQKVYFTFL